MRSILETPRTVMRPFQPGDASEAHYWLSDHNVMRYIPFGADYSIVETSARIDRYIKHQEKHGFSKWAIIDRDTQQLIGDSGFYTLPENKGIEFGYRLSQPYWGRGFATEVAQRWIDVAREFVNAPSVSAFAHPENLASLHVLKKLGFKYSRHEILYGLDAPLYELSLESYADGQTNAHNGTVRDG